MKSDKTGPSKANKANKAPKPKIPFKKAGAGIEAHGTVSELREHQDGDSVRMTVKHGKPKRGGDGIFDTYPDETSMTIPPEAAQQFSMGQRVRVRVHPHADAPSKSGKKGKPFGR